MKGNRLLSLNKELQSYKSKRTFVKGKSAKNGLIADNGKGSRVGDIMVEADVFVIEVLDLFFGKSPEEYGLSDELKDIAARSLWTATTLSKTENIMPGPPNGVADIGWISSEGVQRAFRKINHKGLYKAVKSAVQSKYRSEFETALLSAKPETARQMTMQMSSVNTALVVFIENTGALPFQWESTIGKAVQEGLEKVVDYVSEEFEKWLNKFADAKGKKYREVIILEDAKATYANLKHTLHDLANKEYIIDVFTLTHGNGSSFSAYGGGSISANDVRALRDSYGKALPIRVVYMMNCVGAGLNDDWLYAGARATAGAIRNNYIPEPMMTKVWNNWLRGDSFANAVSTAYNDSVKLISDTIAKADYIPFIGGSIMSALQSKINPLLADSKPKVEGNGSITIDTASLAAAHSLSFSDTVYSEAKYGTGEHVLSGLVDADRVTPTYQIDVNGVKFTYGELIAMGDFYESYDQMLRAKASELSKLKSLIDKSKRFYESKVTRGRASISNTSDAEWQSATGGRYLKLAEDNFAHFAPSNSTYISFSSSKSNHKAEWEKYHKKAIDIMRAGNSSDAVDGALVANAFGDHFLTDAFAAGHLFNKDDLSKYFKSRVMSGGSLTSNGEKMFDNIASAAFRGKLKDTFSKYETVKWEGIIFRPNIDSADIFSKLLQGIMKKEPDIIGKTMVAKLVHDALNEYPGGVAVTNNKGDSWKLTGDGTLDKTNLEIMRKAVKQSITNLYDSVGDSSPYSLFYKKAWDITPRPTSASVTIIKNLVRDYTDPLGTKIVAGADKLLQNNYQALLDELVKRNILKRA
ncbi:hypothetical protein JMN32_04445 [Fulvivirga sp. 29W222]|uniref:Uncharacterized protein n=1 Tax=Fulvivirga marina TaxID=2494733 RepID=A0A937FTL0_9BACT|nr:hypothetical protein [Fulvivirga marina]MBL6445544.1 hypothetical protein [Fulvivirga marina]